MLHRSIHTACSSNQPLHSLVARLPHTVTSSSTSGRHTHQPLHSLLARVPRRVTCGISTDDSNNASSNKDSLSMEGMLRMVLTDVKEIKEKVGTLELADVKEIKEKVGTLDKDMTSLKGNVANFIGWVTESTFRSALSTQRGSENSRGADFENAGGIATYLRLDDTEMQRVAEDLVYKDLPFFKAVRGIVETEWKTPLDTVNVVDQGNQPSWTSIRRALAAASKDRTSKRTDALFSYINARIKSDDPATLAAHVLSHGVLFMVLATAHTSNRPMEKVQVDVSDEAADLFKNSARVSIGEIKHSVTSTSLKEAREQLLTTARLLSWAALVGRKVKSITVVGSVYLAHDGAPPQEGQLLPGTTVSVAANAPEPASGTEAKQEHLEVTSLEMVYRYYVFEAGRFKEWKG